MRSTLLVIVCAGVLVACSGSSANPTDFGAGLDLSGQWRVADSTLYDITNTTVNSDGLRHIGSYVVTGSATVVRGDTGSYASQLNVTITYTDSTAGQPARRTPQNYTAVSTIVVLHDSIFGLSAGGEVVPPAANPTDQLVAWTYDQTEGQCVTIIAGFRPASVSCRQSVRWTR